MAAFCPPAIALFPANIRVSATSAPSNESGLLDLRYGRGFHWRNRAKAPPSAASGSASDPPRQILHELARMCIAAATEPPGGRNSDEIAFPSKWTMKGGIAPLGKWGCRNRTHQPSALAKRAG